MLVCSYAGANTTLSRPAVVVGGHVARVELNELIEIGDGAVRVAFAGVLAETTDPLTEPLPQ